MNNRDPAAQLAHERESSATTSPTAARPCMIREAVETHAPPGSPAEEYVEPPFTAEAEALVKGILAIAAGKRLFDGRPCHFISSLTRIQLLDRHRHYLVPQRRALLGGSPLDHVVHHPDLSTSRSRLQKRSHNKS